MNQSENKEDAAIPRSPFGRRQVGVILLAGLAFRLWIAWQGDFIYHPDELFQYLEQAHRLVFDSGFVPWEYRYGVRSWILPGFIAGFLGGFRLLGLDSPAFYVPAIKAVFCLLSLLIPWGMYAFGRRHFSERAGIFALVLGCFWYELAVFAHKPLTTLVATSFLMLYLGLEKKTASARRASFLGMAGGFSIAIRVQILPLFLIFFPWTAFRLSKRERLFFAGGILIVLGAAGLLDALTWGRFLSSYWENLRINYFFDVSSIFGTLPSNQYLYWLAVTSFGAFYLSLISGIYRERWLIIGGVVAILLTYSLISHKEYRFIFSIVPLWLLLAADGLARISIKANHLKRVVFLLLGLVNMAGIFNALPGLRKTYEMYSFNPYFLKRDPVFEVCQILATESGVTGVLDMRLYSFGEKKQEARYAIFGISYYYLHHQIPIYNPTSYSRFLEGKDERAYVSHIVTTLITKEIPNFKLWKEIQNLRIWRREPFEYPQFTWRHYHCSIPQKEVQDALGNPPSLNPNPQIILVDPK